MPSGRVRTKTPPTEFGRRLTKAREAMGWTLERAAVKIQDALDDGNQRRLAAGKGSGVGPSREQVRRLETGEVPEGSADLVLVAAIARVYGVPVRWLSPYIADKIGVLGRQLSAEDEGVDVHGLDDLFKG